MSKTKAETQGRTKEEKNLAIARRYILEYFNQGDADVADEIFSQDCIVNREYGQTNEERKRYIARIRGSFPDLEKTIIEEMAVGDKVVLLWVLPVVFWMNCWRPLIWIVQMCLLAT